MDYFYYVKQQIGKVTSDTIKMGIIVIIDSQIEGKKALAPEEYNIVNDCTWEWDILGLWSLCKIVLFGIISSCCCDSECDCDYCSNSFHYSDNLHTETSN